MTRILLLIFFCTCVNFSFSQDDPCNAIPLPLSAIGSCTYITGDNTGATDSSNANIDAPSGCEPVSANYNGADVWFYIDLGPTTTSLQIDLTHITGSNFNDGVVALYTGTCSGTLTIVECDDDSGSGALEANFSVVNVLTPNTRVYIRVWDWGGNNEGTFNICASEVENPCNSATNITTCGATPINATIDSGFGAFNDSSCFDVPGDEAVFSFTPTVTGNYSITQISTFDHINYLYQTSCSATGWTCIDDLVGNNETSGFFNLIAGTTYYIMLDSENSNGGNVSFTLNCPIPILPPICGNSFYDTGGPSGDYANNELVTTTITPTNAGDAVTVTFTTFDLESGWDFLYVYDGPDATYPLVGTFSGTGIPGPFTSSDTSGALTFVFNSDGSGIGAGWEANITCGPYVPPTVCGSIFTDTGGVSGDYSNNQNITTTLTPDVPGTNLVATFTAFETENNYDFLYIHDGPNNTFPLIGTYTGTNSPGTVTSSHASGALTFVFTSDVSFTDPGWAADITCVSTCNLIITDTNYPLGADDCNLNYTELTTNAPPPPATTTVFSESFDGATFPAGWTTVNGATSADWIISNSTNAGGAANEAMLDWTSGSDISTWYLSSPAINITGQTNLQLSFNHDLWQFGTDFSIFLETSLNGTTWTPQYTVANPPDITETRNVDISSLDGNNTLYLRFRLTGDSFDIFHWAIDDVIITADGTPSPPQVTWSPAIGLYTDATLTTPYILGNFAGTVYAAPNGIEVYTAEYPLGCTDDITVTFNKKIWNGTPGNTDWNTGTNWFPNGVPTATNCIVIVDTGGNNPIIAGTTNALGYNLAIQTDAMLTIDDNDTDTNYGSLTITDAIDLQGNAVLHILNNSSLVQINEGAANTNNNTGSGTLIMDRVPYVSNTDYVYWSSPVSNMSLSNIYGIDTPNATYQWIPTIPNGTVTLPPGPCTPNVIPFCHGDWEVYAGNMNIGKGYISNGPTSQNTASDYLTSIYGTIPNNGIITNVIESGDNLSTNCNYTYSPNGNPITVTPFDDNWNLIGNPYPSAISANAFINYDDGIRDNTLIEGAIHIWTHGTDATGVNPDPFYNDYVLNYNPNDYLTYNLSGTNTYPNETVATDYYIGSGQGFFVLADFDDGTNDVTFSNTMRNITHDNSSFYRSSNPNPVNTNTIERHRIWLNLSNQNEQTSSTMVGYIEGATQEKDRSYDAYTFESNTMSIYSMIEDKKMVIQGRQLPFESNDQVPLGIEILQIGNYTISISGVDGLFDDNTLQDIYLEDTDHGVIHDLRASPYNFTSESGTFNNRFILRYTNTTLGIDDIDPLNGIQVFEENEKIVVKSDYETIQSIVVYDILGRTLFYNQKLSSNRFEITSIPQSEITLFLKITLVNGKQKITKIIF